MQLAIVNTSPSVSLAELQAMTTAVGAQVTRHLCPAWERAPVPVLPFASLAAVPKGMALIALFDTPDSAVALGWHTEGVDGHVYGKVFVEPVLANGGTVLDGDLSVSSVLSHEVCETIVDRAVSTWDAQSSTRLLAREVCDPVEGDTYLVGNVSVSNFTFPEYFDPRAPKGSRFDQMRKLSAPFTMTPGGYQIIMAGGRVSQVFGTHFPKWKRDLKRSKLGRFAQRA